ncbi:PREDICTED: uncharacterized protein LOC105367695, partial [Ceratosolen solmsi marchali]|uniref:Uncharacterized protein LOC105367695 n=1 Tax=Ceratosolen solmsi marchali TaxID=326594 RepID=A0AAJ6YUV6_9HYME
QSLEIKLQHKVPLQHKIERHAGSRALSKQELQAFEKFAVLKKGVFDKEENSIIKKNWKSFCEIHNWKKNNVKPFLYFSHNGKCYLNFEQRKNFVRFLANGLPSRTLNSVYFRFRSSFDANVNTGKFTHKEDSIIVRHLSNTSSTKLINSSAHVAKILNRKRHSIRLSSYCSRFLYFSIKSTFYFNQDFFTVDINISWTYAMVREFINTLTETSTCKLEELKNIVIDQTIWDEMGKKLNIDQKILQNFWYYQLHMQIFCPEPIYLNELKINLIEYVHRQDDKILENLAWDNVCLKFDGVPSLFLSKLFKHLIEYAKTKINSSTLKVSTDWTLLTIKNFIDVLMEITLCKTIKELKGHKLPDFIWLTMESKLNINYKKLKQLWHQRLHMQLFCVEPIYLNHIKIKLIKYLHKNEITDLKEINWHKVILLFDGVTREYIYRIFTNLIKLGRMKVHSTKFSGSKAIIEYNC